MLKTKGQNETKNAKNPKFHNYFNNFGREPLHEYTWVEEQIWRITSEEMSVIFLFILFYLFFFFGKFSSHMVSC